MSSSSASDNARELPLVAIATSADLPDLDQDGPLLLESLAEQGLAAQIVSWDDPDIPWGMYDLVLVRSTWDYALRRADFLAWAERIGERLVNPAPMLAWNTDKTYLGVLAARGIPVVPTLMCAPGEEAAWPERWTDLVVKPNVSAGAADTARFDLRSGAEQAAAVHELIGRIHATGRTAMLQPYQHRVDTEGETALIYFDGEFSHAARKEPILPSAGATAAERLSPTTPTARQLRVAEAVLAEIPTGLGVPLYLRVDLVPGQDGPLLLELELTEPALFLNQAADPREAARRLAVAVRRAAVHHRSC